MKKNTMCVQGGYEPKNGDIVVISRNAENTIESQQNSAEPIIKRVIAVGGQTVDIDFEKGIVYVRRGEVVLPVPMKTENNPVFSTAAEA